MMIPDEVATVVDASSLRTNSEGGIECMIASSSSVDIETAARSMWWNGVSAICIDRSRTPEELDSAIVNLAAAPSMKALKSLTGLSWQGFSRLCKLDAPLPLAEVGFRWGPAEHVFRRLETTTALPALQRLLIKVHPLDRRVGDLFQLMGQLRRPLKELVLEAGYRLQKPFGVTIEVSGEASAPVVKVTGEGTSAELSWLCEQLGLPRNSPSD